MGGGGLLYQAVLHFNKHAFFNVHQIIIFKKSFYLNIQHFYIKRCDHTKVWRNLKLIFKQQKGKKEVYNNYKFSTFKYINEK